MWMSFITVNDFPNTQGLTQEGDIIQSQTCLDGFDMQREE